MAQEIHVKSILNKTKHRDTWFLGDYTLNPYSGCSFNCLYCYIRGSKYGTHMEEKLSVKINGIELLEKQLALRSRKGQYGIIVLSSSTDPYLQFEKEYQLTRRVLEVILKYRFPVHVITKSDLVVRDIDLLEKIAQVAILPDDLKEKLAHKVFVTFSFSTLDSAVGKIFEPGATPPPLRLQALQQMAQRGFCCGVSLMPLLPHISDTADQLEMMFEKFKSAGAQYIFPASMTLFGYGPSDSKVLVLGAIGKHYPALLEKYETLFADGFQVSYDYQRKLKDKTSGFITKYGLRNSLF